MLLLAAFDFLPEQDHYFFFSSFEKKQWTDDRLLILQILLSLVGCGRCGERLKNERLVSVV